MSNENSMSYGEWLDAKLKETAQLAANAAQRAAQHEKQAHECRGQVISFRGSLAALNEAKKQVLLEVAEAAEVVAAAVAAAKTAHPAGSGELSELPKITELSEFAIPPEIPVE